MRSAFFFKNKLFSSFFRELLKCTNESSSTRNVNCDQDSPTCTSACSSNSACTSSDADLVYASLVFEELNNDLLWNSDSENDTTHQEDLEVKEIKKDLSLQETLSQLALIINVEKISKFNISRSHLWEGALRGVRRKTFSPENKVSIKFTDDIGIAEGAVDLGGPLREFFTLIMEWMINSQLFCGTEKNKSLPCNSNYLTDDFYFYAGELIAVIGTRRARTKILWATPI